MLGRSSRISYTIGELLHNGGIHDRTPSYQESPVAILGRRKDEVQSMISTTPARTSSAYSSRNGGVNTRVIAATTGSAPPPRSNRRRAGALTAPSPAGRHAELQTSKYRT